MKNEATRARKARLAAANRLIQHHPEAPEETQTKPAPPPKETVRRMVKPVEVVVKVVAA